MGQIRTFRFSRCSAIASMLTWWACGVSAPRLAAQDWIFLDGPALAERMSAYDWSRQRLVIFGSDGATWEVAGNELLARQVLGTSPPPRTRGSMVFDFVNQRTLLFGGRDANGTHLNDTWLWDGIRWIAVDGSLRPPPRTDAAIAYDLLRSRVVLYGGQQAFVGQLEDTWEFDGTSWSERHPTTVPGPNAPVMAYDIVNGVTVMVAHVGISGSPVRTWTWDGTDWTLRASVGPTANGNEGLAYDFTRQRTVMLGGVGNEAGIWEWDGTAWTHTALAAVPSRLNPAVHFNPTIGAVEMFGGYDFRVSGGSVFQGSSRTDTHSWDGSVWQRRFGDLRPGTRHSHVLTPDPTGDVLLFGGTRQQAASDETWLWDGNRWTEQSPSTRPSPRAGAAAVLDLARAETLLFGGNANGIHPADLWGWNGQDWTLRDSGTGPPGRTETALAFDVGRLVTVLFGGFVRQGQTTSPVNDTWEWDGQTWRRHTPPVSPSPRAGASLAFDPSIQRTVLFGGRTGFTAQDQLADTWEWDGSVWQRMSPTVSPPALLSANLHFEPLSAAMLLVGTTVSTSPFETQVWQYSNRTWTHLHSTRNSNVGGPTSIERNRGRLVSLKQHALAEWTALPAALAVTGAGCGSMPPILATRTRARFGDSAFGLETADLPLQPAAFVLALSPGSLSLGSGCILHLGGTLIPVAARVDPFGIATLRLPIAASPRLRGLSLYSQALILAPSEPLGMRVSNAIRWTIGD